MKSLWSTASLAQRVRQALPMPEKYRPVIRRPWAGPGVPIKAIKWMLMHFGPLVVRPKFDPYMALWLVRMLRNCTSARYARNKARMVPIAEYSRDCLKALRSEVSIPYDERTQGTLQLFRTQKQYDGTASDIEVLKAIRRSL